MTARTLIAEAAAERAAVAGTAFDQTGSFRDAERRRVVTLLAAIVDLPARALLLLIRVYQRFLSPALPAIFGAACGCRFTPTCSHYAADAIRTHGAFIGVALAAIRLVKCTPFHPGGFNPVPPRRRVQPHCMPVLREPPAQRASRRLC